MTETGDVIELLVADHRAIGALLDELDAADSPADIRELYLRIAAALAAHEAAEQQVVFPALAGAAGDDARLGEHEEINGLLDEMRTLAPSDFGFTKRASALALDIRAHFACEEEDVFPLLRTTFTPARLAELAAEAVQVEAAAPAFPPPGPHADATTA